MHMGASLKYAKLEISNGMGGSPESEGQGQLSLISLFVISFLTFTIIN